MTSVRVEGHGAMEARQAVYHDTLLHLLDVYLVLRRCPLYFESIL